MYFEWTPTLSVGDVALDGDHMKLIELINEFYSATEDENGRKILSGILQRLFNYTREHFDREKRN